MLTHSLSFEGLLPLGHSSHSVERIRARMIKGLAQGHKASIEKHQEEPKPRLFNFQLVVFLTRHRFCGTPY